MAKLGGKLLIKYRDPVAASFSSKDIVLNVQTGTLFYKRNRKLFALRGTPDNFDLVVFPGQSTNQQILINDSSQEDGSPIMEGTDQFRFKLASATCGCANYFHIGAETLTHFSGSVRIGEHLPGTCNLLDSEVDPALLVHGNIHTTASNGGYPGHISASGNVHASLDLYGNNAYIHGSLIHRNNTDTKLTFGTDTINLYSDGSNIATVSSDKFTINGSNDLFIPGTDSSPSSGTSVLVLDNSTGQVYKTGSYGGETFKSTGIRIGDAEITGSLDISSAITASKAQFTNLDGYPGQVPNFSVLTELNGTVFTTSSAAFNHYNFASVSDNGTTVTSNAQIINFVGNAITASGAGNLATVTVNAITESLWYDGRLANNMSSSFLSSSYNILVGNGGNVSASGDLKHEIHITSSNQSASIGFTNASSSHWSTGMIQSSGNNIFHISDHGTANTPTGDGITQVLRIFGTGSGDLLSAPEAISIHSGLRTGGATPNPTFIGATDVNIPTIMIDPVDHSTSLAKLHINTMGVDDGMLYNGLCVGPYFNPNAFPNQRTGSGVFIHIGETQVGDTKESEVPKITGKTELGANWGSGQSRGLVITAETDRSVGYPNSSGNSYVFGNATQQSPIMEFKVQDISKQAYSASINNPTSSGINSFNLGGSPLSFIAPVYGTGDEFIIGMEVIPRNTTNRDANYLYTFANDLMPLLSIEASGKVGIGNFSNNTTGQNAPKAMLDISAKSGSDADILLKTITPNTIPLIKLEVDNYGAQNIAGNSTKLYNPQLHRGEFYMHTDYASGTFYENQKASAVVIESKGKQEGLAGQTYPFNIKGAAANSFETNNIQFVVGGDNSFDRDSTITSSHAHNNGYPPFSNNNGRAAITIEGISDFRRFGEVGIGLANPSSSLHVTRSVQADNFRTTNPVDILGSGSIKTVYGSNIITGSGTNFTTNFKVGDAIKITGKQIISTPPYTYIISSSHASASVSSSIAGVKHQQLVHNDIILISSGALGTGIIQTGSYHVVTSTASSSLNNTVFDSSVDFNPAYTGVTTQSNNIIHRINPYYYQIATVDSIHSDTSMSISQNWEGTTDPSSKVYYEEILFEVKTANYRPVFSIAADGTTTIGGVNGTFKSTGLRQGHSTIEGDLTIRPQDNLDVANLNIISKNTGSAADSILRLKQYDQGANTTGSKLMYNAGDNEFQIYGNKGIDKHLTIHHDSGLVTVNENLTVENNITASNNISASGLLYASSSQGNYSNVVVQDTASGRFYTTSSAALTTTVVDTFKSTGVRVGDSEITGSLIVRPTGGGNDASLKIIGGGATTDDATLSLRQNLTAVGYAVKYDGQLDHFQIKGNNEQDIHLSIQHGDGRVRIPGTISASGKFFGGTGTGGITFGTADRLLTIDSVTGEFKQQGIATALATAGVGLVSSSQQIQNYDDFLLNTTDTLTGDLTVTGTITAQEFHTEFVSSSIIFTSGSTQFGNSSDDIHTFSGSIHVKDEGHITASGNISASGNITSSGLFTDGPISASGTLHAGLTAGLTNYAVFYNTNTGELLHEVAPSSFTAAGISGSWQGQNFVSASQTFLSTGQRNGDSAITGSFEVTSDITSSKLLIQKSTGQGTPTPGSSDIAIFQNNDNSQDASIAIIAADTHRSQLHFGKHDDIDIGSIKYFHDGHSTSPDQFKFKINGTNVVTFNNISNKGRIGVGLDFTPTDYFHAQGALSGGGLTISSSNGGTILLKAANTRAILDRTATDKKINIEFNTAGTTNWTLGNIAESDDNFYIYNGDSTGDKHISLTSDSTTFHTNVTASGNISASGLLFASSSQGNFSDIVVQDLTNGRFYTTSSAGLSVGLDTFKTTGQRNGNSGITGSLHLTGSTSDLRVDGTVGIGTAAPTANNVMLHIKSNHTGLPTAIIEGDDGNSNANLEFKNTDISWITGLTGGGFSDSFLIRSSSANALYPFAIDPTAGGIATAPLLFMRDDKISILRGITPSANLHVSGNIVADGPNGSISASGLLFASSSVGNYSDVVVQDTASGRFYTTSSAALTITLPGGLLSSSAQISSDISGSWQGQNFISASQVISNLIGSAAFSSAVTGSWYSFSQSLQTTLLGITGSNLLNITNNTQNIGENLTFIQALQTNGSISASVLSSPAQGQAQLTTNGVAATAVDLGLETTDKPEFAAVTSSQFAAAANMFIGADYNNNAGNSSNIFFQTKGTTRMTLSGSGNVGIGTSNPTYKLEVVGTIRGLNHISASNKIYGGLDTGVTANTVFYDPEGGELTYGSAPASFTAEDISGSWQGYITGSSIISSSTQIDTFKSTGQRNGDSAITGALEVVGDISASGNLYANKYHSNSYNILRYHINQDRVIVGSKFKTTHITGSSLTLGDGPGFHVTASGNISASGAITASGLLLNDLGTIEWPTANAGRQTIKGTDNYIQIDGDNRVLMAADNDITINSPETNISGDVSASGLLFASSSQGNYSNIVVQDTASGRFYTTASAAIIPDTFKTTGQRSGSSGITGSLIVQGPSHTVSINTAYGNVSSPAGMGQFSTLQIGNNAAIGTATFGGGYGVTGLSIASNGKLQTNSSLTADGKISGSGLLYASASSANGNPYQTVMINTASGEFFYTGSYGGGGGGVSIPSGTISSSTQIQNYDDFLLNTTDTFTGELNVEGHITASGNISGSILEGQELISDGHITASGNISASGNLFADVADSSDTNFKTVMYDTSTGKFFRTGSYGGGSGGSADNLGNHTASLNLDMAGNSIDDADEIEVAGNSGTKGIWANNNKNYLSPYSHNGDMWLRSNSGRFTFQTFDDADNWTNTYQLHLPDPAGTSGGNPHLAELGQRTSNTTTGTYRGTRIVKREGSATVDGELQAGHITASGDISGSGKLFAELTTTSSPSSVPASNNLPITYDPDTGEFKQATSISNFFSHSSVANLAFKTIAVTGTNAVADSSADTLNLNGSTYITVTGTANDTITIAYTGGTGTMSSFNLRGDNTGTSQLIQNGNYLDIKGGTGIATATSATDDLTVNLDLASLSVVTPTGDDSIVFTDDTDSDNPKKVALKDVLLSRLNTDIAGVGLSINANGNDLDFDPGGNAGAMITSDGGSSYNVHNNLVFDGTNLQVHGGDIIAFYSSDKRLKDNVIPITNPISKIMKIGGYTFDWNGKQDTYSGHDVGVIAQEVEKVLPEVVETRENGYKAVKYDKMVPLLIEAIKDQQKQIDELKKLIENGK